MERLNLILLCSWLSTVAVSCRKSDFVPVEMGCHLEASDIKSVKNKTGTLVYYDASDADNTPMSGYFILDHNVSEIGHLPIRICNFTETEFPAIRHGDQVSINFEGRIVILPETADALNTDIELSGVKMAK